MELTFVIPSRNNLEFLKLAYKSIKNLKNKNYILVLDDASTDGTLEWLNSLNDSLLIKYVNPGPDRIGIVGMFDKGVELAPTEAVIAFHADMIAGPNLDIEFLKLIKPKTVISATRVEPPLHPPGPEKITYNLGIEADEFNFQTWYDCYDSLKEDRVTEGIFAPWCILKKDYLDIGGHDSLFAPQSKEDSDLFNRLVLNQCKVIQTWSGLAYHFTSRGSRFNKHSGGSAGQNSPEWIYTTTKNERNFIRKWGHYVKHDALMKPLIPPKYNISLILENANIELLTILEPWFDYVVVDSNVVDEYIKKEQPNTKFSLKERIFLPQDTTPESDITVRINGKNFNQESFNIIQNLSDIIKETGETGDFEIQNINISIKSLQEYQNTLIKKQFDKY